jgi:hypothetical protein
MEVHAPHEPIHSWRDFILHIVTITIGLLIALGLEAGVEALHHRHLRLETRANLRRELIEAQKQLPKNLHALDGEEKELRGDIALLRRLRAHQPLQPGEQFRFDWYWSSMPDAAWQTAHETGVLSLMADDQVQEYSGLYGQQELVDNAALVLTRSMTQAMIPLTVEPDPNQMSPALIDELIRSCATNLNQINYVRTLAEGLPYDYKEALESM